MAPRNLNQGSDNAASEIFEGLGLDVGDLENPADFQDDAGGDDDGDGSGFEQSDDSDRDSADPFQAEPRQGQLDDLRLTQTGRNGQRQPPRKTGNQFDAKGNILGQDGKVAAKAGSEARLYVKAQTALTRANNAEARSTDLTDRLNKAIGIGQQLHTELETLKGRDAKMQEFGLSSDDQINAFQLYQSLKRDTAGTIQKLLTRAAANGIAINGLASGGGGSALDAKGILDLVRQELATGLKPLAEMTTAQKQQKEQEERQRLDAENVQREVSTFFQQNQEAQQYLPVFQKVLADPVYSKMSLGEIWARIQLNLARNPSQRNRQTLRSANSANSTNDRRSLPNGRPLPQRRNDNIAPVDSDYGQILNGILDEAGV